MDNKDKHTKGKVAYVSPLSDDEGLKVVGSQQDYILRAGNDEDWRGPFLDAKDEDVRRIVALWNMAEELNLSTEDIEEGIVQDAFGALREVAGTVRDSDYWWMDCPDRGGIDLAAITDILNKIGG